MTTAAPEHAEIAHDPAQPGVRWLLRALAVCYGLAALVLGVQAALRAAHSSLSSVGGELIQMFVLVSNVAGVALLWGLALLARDRLLRLGAGLAGLAILAMLGGADWARYVVSSSINLLDVLGIVVVASAAVTMRSGGRAHAETRHRARALYVVMALLTVMGLSTSVRGWLPADKAFGLSVGLGSYLLEAVAIVLFLGVLKRLHVTAGRRAAAEDF